MIILFMIILMAIRIQMTITANHDDTSNSDKWDDNSYDDYNYKALRNGNLCHFF